MSRLTVAPFGPAATAALAATVDELHRGDPLRPVDVVVPSALAGVTLRRTLADPARVNVRFGSLPQLAERMARRRIAFGNTRTLTESARSLVLRRALREVSGPLVTAAAHPATTALLSEVMGELDEVEAGKCPDVLAATGARAAEVARLHATYCDAQDNLLTSAQITRLAAASVREGTAPETSVVMFAPHRLSGAGRALLYELAQTGQLWCVVATTGDDYVDAEDTELTAWLEELLGPTQRRTAATPPATGASATTLTWAPDAEEEVREAIRNVFTFLEAHRVRPERVAIAYRSSTPYARLLDEQLSAAGLPFHVSGGRRLADSVPGRILLRLLGLRRDGFARSELLRWMADAPILTAHGDAVPVASWDRLSRNAGVSRGHAVWRSRLTRYAEHLTRQRDEAHDSDVDAEELAARDAQHQRRIAECQDLLAFVDDVVAHCEAVAGSETWADASAAMRDALVRFLGAPRTTDRWVTSDDAHRWRTVERAAYESVLAAVHRLALLDEVDAKGERPTYDTVVEALRRELELSLPSGTTVGRGITVTPLRDLVGADLDLLIVLGMTEDAFPPRMREHPILDDKARYAVGLPTTEDRRRAERRSFLAATAAAAQVVLSAPKADTRAQRGLHPSPWFMEVVNALSSEPVLSKDLTRFRASWFTNLYSFEQGLRDCITPGSASEVDIQLALSNRGDLIAADDTRYARGREAMRARVAGDFNEWTGHVVGLTEAVRAQVDRRLSASSLQTYATCPRRFWLDRALGVHDLEDPGDEEILDRRTRGSLVHRVLERFLHEALPDSGPPSHPGRSPDDPWSAAEIARAQGLLDVEAAALEADGVTGRPLLWQAEKSRLRRQLTRMLVLDSQMRRQRRATPLAVEAAFVRDGVDAFVLELPRSGPVALAGSIDRVDRTEDGTVIVTDYKTGSDFGYDRIPKIDGKQQGEVDLVDRGRKVQLVLYALAARRQFGDDRTPVQAYYWFVEQGGLHRGGPIDPTAERRLLDVFDISVTGSRAGVYPARPGEEDWRGGWTNCTFCPYHRVCPTTRAEQWEKVRKASPVQPYATVAETPHTVERSPEESA